MFYDSPSQSKRTDARIGIEAQTFSYQSDKLLAVELLGVFINLGHPLLCPYCIEFGSSSTGPLLKAIMVPFQGIVAFLQRDQTPDDNPNAPYICRSRGTGIKSKGLLWCARPSCPHV